MKKQQARLYQAPQELALQEQHDVQNQEQRHDHGQYSRAPAVQKIEVGSASSTADTLLEGSKVAVAVLQAALGACISSQLPTDWPSILLQFLAGLLATGLALLVQRTYLHWCHCQRRLR